jgi:metal-dependent amidase/aminoacylase/carboxypeptidase family protein
MHDEMRNWLAAHHVGLATIRQDIHAHPELGME